MTSPAPTPAARPNDALRLAVVIANYNYAEFVGAAIDSALGIDWPALQVVVVDDGSTDASAEVIGRYGPAVTAVFQPNGGQYTAYNTGFAQVADQADVVIFLDADDLLDPQVMRAISRVWRDGASKAQFRLRGIDAAGRPLGNVFPQFPPGIEPAAVRDWTLRTGVYPTPPGSGNAYATAYLRQILPLDGSCDRPGDGPCIAAASLLGEVLTVDEPLGSYRIHGRNDGAASRLDARQFQLHVQRARQRHRYVQAIAARRGWTIDDDALDRSLWYLPYRLASLRLDAAGHPIAGDSRARVLADLLRAVATPQGVPPKSTLALAVWLALVALLPSGWAQKLMLWRFVPTARPQRLRATLRSLRLIH